MTEVITFSDTSIKIQNGIHDHTNSSGTAGYVIKAGGDGSWSWQDPYPKVSVTDFSGSVKGNVIIGHEAANYGNTPNYNVVIGVQAAYNAPDAAGGYAHIAIGRYAQYNGGYKDYSISIGASAGYENQGQDSIAIGHVAGAYTLKDNSIAIGSLSGYENSGTSETIYLGYRAGINGSGSKSILIGGYTSASSTSATNEIVIGHSAVGQGSNSISLGVKDTDRTLYIGRGKIGHMGWNDFFGLAHVDHATITNFALIQLYTGATIINSAANQEVAFAIGGSDKMTINSSTTTITGNVVMGSYDITLDNFSLKDALQFMLRKGLRGRRYSGYYSDNFSFFDTATPINTSGKIEEYMYTNISIGDEGSYYSYKWTGFFIPNANNYYYFQTTSDDASYVVVNGITVVNNGGLHGTQTRNGYIYLYSGTYNKIQVYFGENSGGANMKLEWTVSGGSYSNDLSNYFLG